MKLNNPESALGEEVMGRQCGGRRNEEEKRSEEKLGKKGLSGGERRRHTPKLKCFDPSEIKATVWK